MKHRKRIKKVVFLSKIQREFVLRERELETTVKFNRRSFVHKKYDGSYGALVKAQ
jgi:hypothetical protein